MRSKLKNKSYFTDSISAFMVSIQTLITSAKSVRGHTRTLGSTQSQSGEKCKNLYFLNVFFSFILFLVRFSFSLSLRAHRCQRSAIWRIIRKLIIFIETYLHCIYHQG